MPTTLKQISLIFAGGAASVPLTALGGGMLCYAAGLDFTTGALVAGGVSALASGASIVPTLYPRKRRYASSFAYDTAFTNWTMRPEADGSVTARFRERPVQDFVYHWPGLLPEPVPERIFDDFVMRGYDREKSARNGGRYARNEAWSANYFCRKRRPPLNWSTYQSCMIVLCFTRHHTGKWHTSPGNLIHYHLSVYQVLEAVKADWLWRVEAYQQRRDGLLRRVVGRA